MSCPAVLAVPMAKLSLQGPKGDGYVRPAWRCHRNGNGPRASVPTSNPFSRYPNLGSEPRPRRKGIADETAGEDASDHSGCLHSTGVVRMVCGAAGPTSCKRDGRAVAACHVRLCVTQTMQGAEPAAVSGSRRRAGPC